MKFVVLASGAGTTLDFLLQKQNTGSLRPKIQALITNNPHSGAVQVAQKHRLPNHCLDSSLYNDFDAWDRAVLKLLTEIQPDFLLLAGFLKKIGPQVLQAYRGRIFNTHPSLLPKYGGKGMYGSKVHAAVIAAGDRISGVTVHLVTENFDEGPILMQADTSVSPDETQQSLEFRIKLLEKETILNFLNDLDQGLLALPG
jgi:phosphoribosylglycinamide formyltransferase-1